MNYFRQKQFSAGRVFIGRLPAGEDMITLVEDFCRQWEINMATFSITGTLASFTIGNYDQQQQVYVITEDHRSMEIAGCTGDVCLKKGAPGAQASIILCDESGKTTGGRLFSQSLINAGELFIQELIGPAMERRYDPSTGRLLWHI